MSRIKLVSRSVENRIKHILNPQWRHLLNTATIQNKTICKNINKINKTIENQIFVAKKKKNKIYLCYFFAYGYLD